MIFQAKEIEMVNGQSPALVFVHDSKGRARHSGVALQTRNESLREQGLPAAQFAFEGQKGPGDKIVRKSPRDRFRISGAVGNERSHVAICELRLALCD